MDIPYADAFENWTDFDHRPSSERRGGDEHTRHRIIPNKRMSYQKPADRMAWPPLGWES